MSAAPLETADAAKDAISTTALSLAAMAARLVLAKDKVNAWAAAAYCGSAVVTGYFVGRLTAGRLEDGVRDCVIGVCAYAAPEVLGYVLRIVQAKGEEAVQNAEAKLKKSKPARPGKRKRG